MPTPSEAGATGESTRIEAEIFPRRILLVDDSEDERALTLASLHRPGSEIVVADRGAAALVRMEQEQFDLILIDAPMATMDGCEAMRRIRALEAETNRPRVPIIALTAHAFREEGARCLEAGCDARVAKPVDQRALFEAIRSCSEELRVEPDAEIADLLPDYLAHRWADLDALWIAIADGNWALARRLGHDMKGSGRIYGLPRVSEIGARLETSGRASDRREASLALSSLESFLARVARRTGNPVAPSGAPGVNPPRSPSD